jgi:tetratricopeptide (TPR) repeat protein
MNVEDYFNNGLYYNFVKNDKIKAIKLFTEALKLDTKLSPANAFVFYQRGILYYNLKEPLKAICYNGIIEYAIIWRKIMDKNIENIIENIDFSMKMEDMSLTEDDKYRLRDCITGKADINKVLQETIKKYKIKEYTNEWQAI